MPCQYCQWYWLYHISQLSADFILSPISNNFEGSEKRIRVSQMWFESFLWFENPWSDSLFWVSCLLLEYASSNLLKIFNYLKFSPNFFKFSLKCHQYFHKISKIVGPKFFKNILWLPSCLEILRFPVDWRFVKNCLSPRNFLWSETEERKIGHIFPHTIHINY